MWELQKTLLGCHVVMLQNDILQCQYSTGHNYYTLVEGGCENIHIEFHDYVIEKDLTEKYRAFR